MKGMEKDISPISLRLLLSSHHPYGLFAVHKKYALSWKQLMRVGGAGYRQMGAMTHTLSRHFHQMFLMYSRPGSNSDLPLEWWLGRGCSLNPYLKGHVMNYMRELMKPKD